jgi:hypothetical protein
MASMPDSGHARRVPKPSGLYWISQAAGWSAYATYVVALYLFFNPNHQAGVAVLIVLFCTVPPVLLTHALRAWMYVNGWPQLSEWRRKVRQFPAALVLAVVATIAVGFPAGLSQGRVWAPTEGMGWTLLGYYMAFGGWIWIYETVQQRRRRDDLERLARETQLRSLRAQVNPHFLFNSLNSVRSLITEDPQRAASMITGLSEVLRYSLASDRHDTVPLAEELDVIDEYVGVERVRFEARLQFERAIEPAALATRVPPMLVQTLVENAVKHGITELPQGGLVRLEARVREGQVEIVVANSGRFKPPQDGSGYGLRNARERLRLLYGERASLTVRDDGDKTTATLWLPLEPVA